MLLTQRYAATAAVVSHVIRLVRAVDCGDALPHASEYSISGMLIAFDDKTVWETVCAGLDLLGKE